MAKDKGDGEEVKQLFKRMETKQYNDYVIFVMGGTRRV